MDRLIGEEVDILTRKINAEEAAGLVKSGQTVFLGSGYGEPQTLVEALMDKSSVLEDVILINMSLGMPRAYVEPQYWGHLRLHTVLPGGYSAKAITGGEADYIPCNISTIPSLFENEYLVPDVALVQVTAPDEQGYCSLGVSFDFTLAAIKKARLVIAEMNRQMPFIYGENLIHINELDYIVGSDRPLIVLPEVTPGPVEEAIGRNVAQLVPDGASFQCGIGALPEAVLASLAEKNDLGVHSGFISDTILKLMDKGVVNNRYKEIDHGFSIGCSFGGSLPFYEKLHRHPQIKGYPVTYTHNVAVMGQLSNFIAINSCLEVDLTGQANAEFVRGAQFSGTGGQVDFIRGATASPGGKAILALPSTAANGTISRIVPTFKEGTPVTTTKADIHYVVTEYGIANLRGKTLRERQHALIAIAHPDFREELSRQK
ncbi:MAG: acetyl-CoA hydrolase/transferase family protein [Bacillota bacterium]